MRFEVDDTLKSWALPKNPPQKIGEKRLAVSVPDHPIEYALFDGEIPEGNYGAGKVKIWDIKIKTKNEFIGFKSSIPIRKAQVVEKDGILTKGATVNDASNWREVQIMNPNNEEIQFRLQIEHRSPYEKDLELQISLNGVNDYEYSVYIQDRFLDSDRGNTAEQDQTLQRHLSKPIKIYANNLFLR